MKCHCRNKKWQSHRNVMLASCNDTAMICMLACANHFLLMSHFSLYAWSLQRTCQYYADWAELVSCLVFLQRPRHQDLSLIWKHAANHFLFTIPVYRFRRDDDLHKKIKSQTRLDMRCEMTFLKWHVVHIQFLCKWVLDRRRASKMMYPFEKLQNYRSNLSS